MGIDFSLQRREYESGGPEEAPSWSYGGFMRFRERIAKLIGIDLKNMKGFGGDGSWDAITDPIKPFLNHSDCDGFMDPYELVEVAPRLRELVGQLPSENELDDWDKTSGVRLVLFMEHCAETYGSDAEVWLIFC